MTKPINFRPKESDQIVIDLLMDTVDFKNASEMVRCAIWEMAQRLHGDDLKERIALVYSRVVVPEKVELKPKVITPKRKK